MAAKNRLDPFPVIVNGDMSGNITQQKPTNIQGQDNVVFQVVWSGTALVGSFVIEGTSDDVSNPAVVPSWVAYDFGSGTATPIPDSGPSNADFTLVNVAKKTLRFRYAATSGTGTLNVKIEGKGT